MQKTNTRNSIIFYLNGKRHEVVGQDTLKPFAYYLRYHLDLPGTKTVCSEGDCGACTVLAAAFKNNTLQNFKAINSCIAPVFSLDLHHIVTVEGLADENQISEVQKCFVENNAAQCGYCTPGFVCAVTALAEDAKNENKSITEKKARNYLTGNLCRCTGYEPILKAATALDLNKYQSLNRFVLKQSLAEFKELQQTVCIQQPDLSLYLPKTIHEALELKKNHVRVIAGATDIGVLINKDKLQLNAVMSLMHIDALSEIKKNKSVISIGATATLAELEEILKTEASEFSKIFRIFASPQIKNRATLIGNVVNASPIADSIPGLMVLNSSIVAESVHGKRKIPLTSFYKGYKTLDLKPEEIVTGLEFEIPNEQQIFKLYKVSPRKDLDISVVTFAALFEIENNQIMTSRLALGGVGPTVLRLPKLEALFANQNFTFELFKKLSPLAKNEISPLSDLRGSQEFRLQLVENLMLKFYSEVSHTHELNQKTEPGL